jgi:hypothetical protein
MSGQPNAFSQTLIERSGYADDAYTALYDRARPTPPADLPQVLVFVAQTERDSSSISGPPLVSRPASGRRAPSRSSELSRTLT